MTKKRTLTIGGSITVLRLTSYLTGLDWTKQVHKIVVHST